MYTTKNEIEALKIRSFKGKSKKKVIFPEKKSVILYVIFLRVFNIGYILIICHLYKKVLLIFPLRIKSL